MQATVLCKHPASPIMFEADNFTHHVPPTFSYEDCGLLNHRYASSALLRQLLGVQHLPNTLPEHLTHRVNHLIAQFCPTFYLDVKVCARVAESTKHRNRLVTDRASMSVHN